MNGFETKFNGNKYNFHIITQSNYENYTNLLNKSICDPVIFKPGKYSLETMYKLSIGDTDFDGNIYCFAFTDIANLNLITFVIVNTDCDIIKDKLTHKTTSTSTSTSTFDFDFYNSVQIDLFCSDVNTKITGLASYLLTNVIQIYIPQVVKPNCKYIFLSMAEKNIQYLLRYYTKFGFTLVIDDILLYTYSKIGGVKSNIKRNKGTRERGIR